MSTKASSAAVPSPCVDVCRMNPATGLCEGCLRTIDEIAAWGSLDDAAKRAVWARLHARRVAQPGAGVAGAGIAAGSTR
ncbi:MAG: DUF1289 domain-containing protein [Burkholderiaceae bacterium]